MFYPSVINKTLNKPVKRKITKIIIYNDIFLVMINKEALATVKNSRDSIYMYHKRHFHDKEDAGKFARPKLCAAALSFAEEISY